MCPFLFFSFSFSFSILLLLLNTFFNHLLKRHHLDVQRFQRFTILIIKQLVEDVRNKKIIIIIFTLIAIIILIIIDTKENDG